MNSLISIAGSWIWYVICISAFILFAGTIPLVYQSLYDRRNKVHFCISVLNLVIISVLLTVLMDCAQFMNSDSPRKYSGFQLTLFNMPYYIYAVVLFISCILFLAIGFEGANYRSHNIVFDTVQQAIDVLPQGIAICTKDGTVCLSNIRINTLCRAMNGKVMADGSEFWNDVEEFGIEQGRQFVITVVDEVWLIGKESISVNEKEYDQITALNITERYRIIKELERKNEHLQDIRRRMKAVSELSGDMFIAQEEADARAALHNQLGQVLLMGRHYINHQDITDPNIVYAATMQMNQFLLGEANEPYKGEEDDYSQAVPMANSIGVKVVFDGAEPENKEIRKILAKAITECAANTVKHAEGDTLFIRISYDLNKTDITITNNGKKPVHAITESGGLLSLRRNVEAMGGKMVIKSEDGFELNLNF